MNSRYLEGKAQGAKKPVEPLRSVVMKGPRRQKASGTGKKCRHEENGHSYQSKMFDGATFR